MQTRNASIVRHTVTVTQLSFPAPIQQEAWKDRNKCDIGCQFLHRERSCLVQVDRPNPPRCGVVGTLGGACSSYPIMLLKRI